MTAAVERALLAELGSQVYTGSASVNDDIEYSLSLLEFARPEEFQADLIALAGPTFVYAALLFNFVIVLGAVVSEKEKHLREAMRLMGLRSLPYWTSWAVTAFVFNVISVFIIIISGAIFQFRFFLENDFRTYFVLFLLFAAAMVPVALFLSVFVSKEATATSLGFIVFLVGTMAQVFQQLVYGESGEGTIYPILASLVPPVLLSAPLVEMIRPKVKVRAVGAAFGAADDDGSHTNVWGLRMPTQTIGEFASEHGYAPTTLASVVEECMAEYARFDVLVRIDMPVMLALGGPGIGSFAAEGPDFEAMMREAKSFGPFKVMTAKGMGGSGGLGTRLRHEIVLSLELPADEPKWVVSDVNHALGVFGGYLRSRMNAVEELGAP